MNTSNASPRPGETNENTHHVVIVVTDEDYETVTKSAAFPRRSYSASPWTPKLGQGVRVCEMSPAHFAAFKEAVKTFNEGRRSERKSDIVTLTYIRMLPDGVASDDPETKDWQRWN